MDLIQGVPKLEYELDYINNDIIFKEGIKIINLDFYSLCNSYSIIEDVIFPKSLQTLSISNLDSTDMLKFNSNLKSLKILKCNHNISDNFLNNLPNSIIKLIIRDCYFEKNYINKLPDNLKELYIENSKITEINYKFTNLKKLKLYNNSSENLNIILPESMIEFRCNQNQLIKLPELKNCIHLKILICNNNKLIELPELPNSIEKLICSNNKITNLNKLPNNLKILQANNNKITSIRLNDKIKDVSLSNNHFKTLDYLPDGIESLKICTNNKLIEICEFPDSLKSIKLSYLNKLRYIYPLPNNVDAEITAINLDYLDYNENKLGKSSHIDINFMDEDANFGFSAIYGYDNGECYKYYKYMEMKKMDMNRKKNAKR